MHCSKEFQDQGYNTYLSGMQKIYCMVFQTCFTRGPSLHHLERIQRKTSLGKGFSTGAVIWDPWKQERTTNEGQFHIGNTSIWVLHMTEFQGVEV